MATYRNAAALDEQIIVLAAGWVPQKEIAAQLHVHRNTISRRLAVPSVQARVAELRAQVQRHAEGQVIAGAERLACMALDRLEPLLDGSPAKALGAAKAILDFASKPRVPQSPERRRRKASMRQGDVATYELYPGITLAGIASMGQEAGRMQHGREEEYGPASPPGGHQEQKEAWRVQMEERWAAEMEALKRWPVS